MGRFTFGLLAGLAVGVLIAPEPGEETRQNIADTAAKWREQFNRLMGRAGAQLDDLRTMLGSQIEGLTDDNKSKIMAILDEIRDADNKGSHEFAKSGETHGEFRPI